MKKKAFILLLSLSVLFSCNHHTGSAPQTDIETATAFIRDVLDNDLSDAEQFVLKDEANDQYFEVFKRQYANKTKEELDNFKKADIIIHETSNVTDSITIINYSNSYQKNANSKLKLVRINGKWLIDFKYTFSGNM